jgi:acyl-CoA synthetase (AMP-forming)/AMP-acid ligase II
MAIRLHDALDYWTLRLPDSLYSVGSHHLTYSQAARLASEWAAHLIAAELESEDRVALLLKNDALAPLGYFSVSKADLVAVPLNTRLAPTDQARLIGQSGARALIATDTLLHELAAADVDLGPLALFVVGGRFDGAVELPAMPSGTQQLPQRPCRSPVAIQSYTSGTTGVPKAALLRHDAFAKESMRWSFAGMRLEAGERFYLCLPPMLTAGFCLAYHVAWCGATLHAEGFSAAGALRVLREGQIAATSLVPTMIHMLLQEAERTGLALRHLRWLFYGAAPMSVALLERTAQVLDCALYQGYGATETLSITLLTPEDHERAMHGQANLLRSVGRPQFGCDIMIADESGAPAKCGEVGEICSRGDQLFDGYADASRTAAAMRDGWYLTGDLGYADDDGYVYLTDRKDNMIITGGINVSPAEVEAVIERVAGVREVAVVGLPDEMWGQRLVAVVAADGSDNYPDGLADRISGRCTDELPDFKRPKAIHFVAELPRNANGKVMHHAVRASLPKRSATGQQGRP